MEFVEIALQFGSLVAWPAVSGRKARASASPAGDVEIDILTETDAFEALGPEHRTLEAKSPHALTAFQTHAFLAVWLRHCAPQAKLRVVTLRRRGELILSLPLVERETPFGRIAEIAGAPLRQYGDAVLGTQRLPADAFAHALAGLRTRFGISAVLFHGVRRDGALAGWLRDNAKALGAPEAAPCLALDAEDAEPSASRRSMDRQTRRTMRRLEKLGEVTFATLDGGDEAVALLREAVAMKEAWLAEHGLAGRAFADRRAVECLEDLVRRGDGGALVSRLSLDGRPVAIEIGFLERGHYAAYLGAFSADMVRYGVGKLQIAKTIEALTARGATTYDLLPPADAYKQEWADSAVMVDDYAVTLSPLGALPLAWRNRLPRMAKGAFERLPRPVRARLRTLAHATG